MGLIVTGGASIQCSFGVAPSVLMVLPACKVTVSLFVATIMDNKPFVNIMPFGMCTTLSNPTVAAATAAALGVLTPMPCVPVTVAPWIPGKPTVLVGSFPALTDSSILMCMWGGVIKINTAGQFKVQL
ncbi:MAG TPA: DUF4280 domain-containing protein [Syntrophobacteraceae bacterium]|nr:DUF4280 domain-containing protein [Syntrophobacteraceae bacterium]